MGRGAGCKVERKIFYGIGVAQAAALPSAGRSGFYNEECDARTVGAARVEQGAQNFFLRGTRVNAGDGLHQVAVCVTALNRASRARLRRCRWQFGQNALDQLRL